MKKQREKDVYEQVVQDIYFHSEGAEYLTIGILPHVEFSVSTEQVATVLKLMKRASKRGAKFDDTHSGDAKCSVERMVDCSSVNIGEFALTNLNDSQWIGVYQSLFAWVQWAAALEDDGDWSSSVPADPTVFDMFDSKLSDVQKKEMAKKSYEEIFMDTQITLKPKK